jgi:hypothetical protein
VTVGNTDFNKIQYGTYISAGYNTINLYAYYGLNSLFKSAQVNGESKREGLNIGIISIFYNQRTSKSNCGTTPKTNPSMSSVLVWAFISKREEATNHSGGGAQ